jgi:hypothetical protein
MDKLKTVDWRGLARSASNRVKQYALNLSDLELKVEEATNKDSWGPHGSVMAGMLPRPPLPAAGSPPTERALPLWLPGIAEACYDIEGYKQVMGVLARRLQEKVRAPPPPFSQLPVRRACTRAVAPTPIVGRRGRRRTRTGACATRRCFCWSSSSSRGQW